MDQALIASVASSGLGVADLTAASSIPLNDPQAQPETRTWQFFRYARAPGADRATWNRCLLIRVPGGLRDTASEIGTLLHDKDILRRGGLVFHTPKTDLEFLPMNPETFRTWCEQHLLFFKVRPSPDGQVIRCLRTMSGAEAEGILAAPQFLGELREVERFNPVRMPVRRKSGGIGLLPPLALPPAFIYLANREGAGKTLLAKVCTVPVLGYAPTAAWPKADEEMDKRLLAAVMGGLPVLILDNVRNHISSGPLELFLTNSHCKGPTRSVRPVQRDQLRPQSRSCRRRLTGYCPGPTACLCLRGAPPRSLAVVYLPSAYGRREPPSRRGSTGSRQGCQERKESFSYPRGVWRCGVSPECARERTNFEKTRTMSRNSSKNPMKLGQRASAKAQNERTWELQDEYDCFSACEAATGIPLAALRRAKRRRCSAVRDGKVRLAAFLRWWHATDQPQAISDEVERAAQVLLQNEKLRVIIRRMKRELVSAREVSHLGAELGAAIRKLVTRIHRMAPSLAGHDVATIEKPLQEQEDDIVAQLRIVDDRMSAWRQAE